MFKWRHIIIPSLILGGILVSSTARAATKFNITVKPVLSVEMTTNPVSFEADSTLHTGYVNLNVVSNNETGFTATMTTNGESTSLNHATDNSYSIPSITSESTSTDFPLNHWGYSVDNGVNFAPIPALGSTPATVLATTKANDFGRTNIFFGIKVDDTNISGIYQNTILVTVVPNFVPPVAQTLADITYMQDVTPEICDATETATATDGQYQLIDNRDNKTYWIAKLADGKCWMTQNLDLNLDSTVTLTNENTDLNSVTFWTPARSTIDITSNMTTTGTSATITGWTDDNNIPYSVDPGNVYFDGTYYSSSTCNYLTANCEHFKNTKQILNNEHGHVGNYYNWTAAVASNDTLYHQTYGDRPDSICPKGWRLPHGYGSGNDFQTLVAAYGNITNSDQTLLEKPLFFVRASGIASGSLGNADGGGVYWSSTANYQEADDLSFSPSSVSSNNYNPRLVGFPVRCVAHDIMHTITWNANGGVVDATVTAKVSGLAIGVLPIPTYAGHSFQGWFTEASGGTQIFTTTIVTTDATYYAHWGELISFDVAFSNAGKSKQNGHYKMQDMTTDICSTVTTPTTITEDISTQLIDIRDNKVYWVSKLKDGKCWMTQNLDLNLSSSVALTNETTDLNTVSAWTPNNSTTTNASMWPNIVQSDYFNACKIPFSYDPGDVYYYVANYSIDNDTKYSSMSECVSDHTESDCKHYSAGNYYSWTASIASNDSTRITTNGYDAPNSICPKGWRLWKTSPGTDEGEMGALAFAYGLINSPVTTTGYNISWQIANPFVVSPIFMTRSSTVYNGTIVNSTQAGYYWSSTVYNPDGYSEYLYAHDLSFTRARVTFDSGYRGRGHSVRCIAR